MIYELLGLYFFHLLHARYEVFIDQKLAKEFNADGRRSKMENDLMHKYQMPYRGSIILLSVLAVGLMWENSLLEMILMLINVAAVFWILLDVLANRTWLKQEWWKVGKTPLIDRSLPAWGNWSIKALILTGTWVLLLL